MVARRERLRGDQDTAFGGRGKPGPPLLRPRATRGFRSQVDARHECPAQYHHGDPVAAAPLDDGHGFKAGRRPKQESNVVRAAAALDHGSPVLERHRADVLDQDKSVTRASQVELNASLLNLPNARAPGQRLVHSEAGLQASLADLVHEPATGKRFQASARDEPELVLVRATQLEHVGEVPGCDLRDLVHVTHRGPPGAR